MIVPTRGDLLQADADALVCPVNCVGVMGAGLAHQIRRAWPQAAAVYTAACRQGAVRPGRVLVVATCRSTNPRYLIHFPTKRHWRDRSQITDIEAGLVALAAAIRQYAIRSIAIPALGAGLGGLPWPLVRRHIVRALDQLTDVTILLFEPVAQIGRPDRDGFAA